MASSRPHGRNLSSFPDDDYMPLDRLSVALTKDTTGDRGEFTLCFWIYLLKSTSPGVVIRQGRPHASAALPFLSINSDLILTLHPVPPPVSLSPPMDSSKDVQHVTADQPCALEKWLHIGCEVSAGMARLHIDGQMVAHKAGRIFSPETAVDEGGNVGPVLLSGGDGSNTGGVVEAFAHFVKLLAEPTVTNHYVKNPPLELTLDAAVGPTEDGEVEEENDGVWSVVGGKASCRRNFGLDVVLLDALGRSIHRDMEVVASLVYADDISAVQKVRDDSEAPLLTTFDGVEFPSTDRPVRLTHGRASFKLKISQLSSKCENRLFRVRFDPLNMPRFPFLSALSRPIRCVSRNRNTRPQRRPNPALVFPFDSATPPHDLRPAMAASHPPFSGRHEMEGAPPLPGHGSVGSGGSPPKRLRLDGEGGYRAVGAGDAEGGGVRGQEEGRGAVSNGYVQESPIKNLVVEKDKMETAFAATDEGFASTSPTSFLPSMSAASDPLLVGMTGAAALPAGPAALSSATAAGSTRSPAATPQPSSAAAAAAPAAAAAAVGAYSSGRSTRKSSPTEEGGRGKSKAAASSSTSRGSLSIAPSPYPPALPTMAPYSRSASPSVNVPSSAHTKPPSPSFPHIPLPTPAPVSPLPDHVGRQHPFSKPAGHVPMPPVLPPLPNFVNRPSPPPDLVPFSTSFSFPPPKTPPAVPSTFGSSKGAREDGGEGRGEEGGGDSLRGLEEGGNGSAERGASILRDAEEEDSGFAATTAAAAAAGGSGHGTKGSGSSYMNNVHPHPGMPAEVKGAVGAHTIPSLFGNGFEGVPHFLPPSPHAMYASLLNPYAVAGYSFPPNSMLPLGANGFEGRGQVAAPHAPHATSDRVIQSEAAGVARSLMEMVGEGEEEAVPDKVLFRYCLESVGVRAEFLKLLVKARSESQIAAFADEVSACTKCSHNGHQVRIARCLLQEGDRMWRSKSSGSQGTTALWADILPAVEDAFHKTLGSSQRKFSYQEKQFLRRIAGCHSSVSRAEFDRLWQWLYPLALTVAQPQLRPLWESKQPMWVVGMVSREEAEMLLANPKGSGQPIVGEFLVRFASSRVWPHPDAGALVVSFVGRGGTFHHKLLSLQDDKGKELLTPPGLLSEALLSQPELKVLHSPPWLEEQNGIRETTSKKKSPREHARLAKEAKASKDMIENAEVRQAENGDVPSFVAEKLRGFNPSSTIVSDRGTM